MRPCRKCSELIRDDATSCKYCGEPTAERPAWPTAGPPVAPAPPAGGPRASSAATTAPPRAAPLSAAAPVPGLAVAAPITELQVQESEGRVRVTWRGGSGVRIHRLRARPTWAEGTPLSADVVRAMGAPLPELYAREAEDPSPLHGLSHYLAVQDDGAGLVAGPARAHLVAADILDLRAEERPRELLLLWQWPEGCRKVTVAWRADGYATDAEDPQAERHVISQGEYAAAGGFFLPKAPGAYFFSVFSWLEVERTRRLSPGTGEGARCELRVPIVIRYCVEEKGLLRKSISLSVSSDVPVPQLPEVVLAFNRAPAPEEPLQPLRHRNSEVQCSSGGGESVNAQPRVIATDARKWSSKERVYLRAFFRDERAYDTFSLQEPPVSQLKR